jgi:spore coat-associated protein N
MKKILGLAVGVLLVIGLAGGGTWAFFSDTEASHNNSLTAGTLDLTINGGNSAVTTFNAPAVVPGDTGSGSSTLRNAGSLSGNLSLAFSTVTNTAGLDGTGNLGAAALMAVYIDVNNNSAWDAGDIGLKSDGTTYAAPAALNYAVINSYGSRGFTGLATLAAGISRQITINWQVPASTGNEIQGDGLSFGVTFTLNQVS